MPSSNYVDGDDSTYSKGIQDDDIDYDDYHQAEYQEDIGSVLASFTGEELDQKELIDELIDKSRAYAKAKVKRHYKQIMENLARKGIRPGQPIVLDMAFPGCGYWSIAAGGLVETLSLINEFSGTPIFFVDRCSGASGGACALFLILGHIPEGSSIQGPNPVPNSELLLRKFFMFGADQGFGVVERNVKGIKQAFAGMSDFWKDVYYEIEDEDAHAFKVLQKRAFVAAKIRPLQNVLWQPGRVKPKFVHNSSNFIFHNFATRDQMANAFVATGEATVYGLLDGVQMLNIDTTDAFEMVYKNVSEGSDEEEYTLPLKFWDGGWPLTWKEQDQKENPSLMAKGLHRKNALLYYHMLFSTDDLSAGSAVSPKESLAVFKKGVCRTIHMLCADDFSSWSYNDAGTDWKGDRMTIILPNESLADKLEPMNLKPPGILSHGVFIDMSRKEILEENLEEEDEEISGRGGGCL